MCWTQLTRESKTKAAQIYDVGTQAHIIDFDQADNGLLGIVAQGGEKFTVIETDVARDGLMRAQVRLLSEPAQPLSERYDPMVSVLRDLLAHPLIQELNPQIDFHEDRSVSHRLADLLPIAPEAKQWLLEISSPETRACRIAENHQATGRLSRTAGETRLFFAPFLLLFWSLGLGAIDECPYNNGMKNDIASYIATVGQNARESSRIIGSATSASKSEALKQIAAAVDGARASICDENAKDMAAADCKWNRSAAD